ncbi:hypothetical protein OS493_007665 [Desmophyllum pertusum]|uniref:Uncharacterized protein n=1 Tax=Desmophyllum pertusum TaxID=174260 RepID=A0A9X0CLY6_9CNID|nr:hypothetical protein OS493_007665 [Desmophyllum pertusum]
MMNGIVPPCSRLLSSRGLEWSFALPDSTDAINALGVTSGPVDTVGSLTEADFPTERVRQLEDDIRKVLQAESAFLKEDVKDELIGIRSDIAQSNQERQEDVDRTARETKEEIHELKEAVGLTSRRMERGNLGVKENSG